MTAVRRGEATVPVELVERVAAQNLHDYVGVMKKVAPETRIATISCAGGVAAFTGVDSPLTTVKGAGPEISYSDIDETIAFFKRHGSSSVTFELARSITAETKARLATRGFEPTETEDVVACRLPRDAPTGRHSVKQMGCQCLGSPVDGSFGAFRLADIAPRHRGGCASSRRRKPGCPRGRARMDRMCADGSRRRSGNSCLRRDIAGSARPRCSDFAHSRTSQPCRDARIPVGDR